MEYKTHEEIMNAIKELRAMGAMKVRVENVEATFFEPEIPSSIPDFQVMKPESEEDKKKYDEEILFYSSQR